VVVADERVSGVYWFSWCLMLVVFWWLMVVLVVVHMVASGGYAFCGFSSTSFVVDEVFKYTDVSWCGLFKVRLHGFLVGLLVNLERFFNGLEGVFGLLLKVYI
jgi:hypothetical protein